MKTRLQDKPKKKISETFLRFAAPVLSTMPEGATPSEIENVLRVPHMIWNALVLDQASGTTDWLTRVRQSIAHSHGGVAVIEDLIDRKRRLFADENLLIGEFRVTRVGPGKINLWAEARNPYSAITNQGTPNKTAGGDA
jgi:hypothetical protein